MRADHKGFTGASGCVVIRWEWGKEAAFRPFPEALSAHSSLNSGWSWASLGRLQDLSSESRALTKASTAMTAHPSPAPPAVVTASVSPYTGVSHHNSPRRLRASLGWVPGFLRDTELQDGESIWRWAELSLCQDQDLEAAVCLGRPLVSGSNIRSGEACRTSHYHIWPKKSARIQNYVSPSPLPERGHESCAILVLGTEHLISL